MDQFLLAGSNWTSQKTRLRINCSKLINRCFWTNQRISQFIGYHNLFRLKILNQNFLTKMLFDTDFFNPKTFWAKILFAPDFFNPKTFWTLYLLETKFLDFLPKIILCQNFLDQKLFLPTFFQTVENMGDQEKLWFWGRVRKMKIVVFTLV